MCDLAMTSDSRPQSNHPHKDIHFILFYRRDIILSHLKNAYVSLLMDNLPVFEVPSLDLFLNHYTSKHDFLSGSNKPLPSQEVLIPTNSKLSIVQTYE